MGEVLFVGSDIFTATYDIVLHPFGSRLVGEELKMSNISLSAFFLA